MKFFDMGPRATGIIAVGQEATGFFAFGQVATGVIAIGQLARGCFAFGQAAVGLVGWGQLGVGLFHAAGMVGVGGRRGLGLVIPLVPSLGRPRVPPPTVPLAAVHAGQEGWVELDLAQDQLGLGLYQNGQRLPIKLDRRLQSRSREITQDGPRRVFAYTKRIGAVTVCDRIAHEPPRPYQKKGFGAISAIQLVALLGLGIVYWAAVGHDLVKILDELGGGGASHPAPVHVPAKPRRR